MCEEKHGPNSKCSRSPWKQPTPVGGEKTQTREYYELHITMLSRGLILKENKYIRECVEALGWTYSRIDGDPVEGPGVKHYATAHMNQRHSRTDVLAFLLHAVAVLKGAGINVTRDKIELVIHDSSSSKVRV